ncbi:MAG: type II toxin-antitoxin system RelE/ParE family toxin [Terriglobia bacterium]
MARIIWADSAICELDAIADYIAVENATAARGLVRRVFAAVERLRRLPRMGSLPNELSGLSYRQLIVSPCRIFYRTEKKTIFIVHVLRGEQLVRTELFPASPGSSKSSRKGQPDENESDVGTRG